MDTNDIDPTEHTPVASIFGQPTEIFNDAERALASTQAEDVVIEQAPVEQTEQPAFEDYTPNEEATYSPTQVIESVHEQNLSATNAELVEQAEPLELPETQAVEAYEADTPVEAPMEEAPPATNEFVAEGATPFPEAEPQETITEASPEPEAVVTADIQPEAAEQAPELPAEVTEGLAIGETVADVISETVAAPVEVAAVAEPIPAVAAAPEEVVIKPKSKRGFASMTPERRREIAAKGGKSVPKTSRYFYQSHENASNAGKIGGKVKGPRKPKAKPEAVTVAPEPTPTVVEAVPVEIPIEHTPVEHTVFDTPVLEAPVEQTVVEAQPEVAPEPVPEVVPPSPIETITEGEPEIPEYLRRLAGVKTENI